MITIYNKANKSIYKAELRMWNEEFERYEPDILQEVDIDLAKQWDPMIGMYVMSNDELKSFTNFWKDEVRYAKKGISDLLDYAEYHFDLVRLEV